MTYLFASIVNAVHYVVCHVFVILGNVLYGLFQDSLEIIFREKFALLWKRFGFDSCIRVLSLAPCEQIDVFSAKMGIGYLNSPLVDAGVGEGCVADEGSSTGGAGGLGIDGGLGIPLSFLARGGSALLPDELSLQLLSSSLLLLLEEVYIVSLLASLLGDWLLLP
jgi:hypothetical protein